MASVGSNPIPEEIRVQQHALRPCKHIISIHLQRSITKLKPPRSLLRGEPTQMIVTYKQIHEREELLEAMKAELERRGRTIDITPKEMDNSTPQGAVEQNGSCT